MDTTVVKRSHEGGEEWRKSGVSAERAHAAHGTILTVHTCTHMSIWPATATANTHDPISSRSCVSLCYTSVNAKTTPNCTFMCPTCGAEAEQ